MHPKLEEIDNTTVVRIREMMAKGLDIRPILRFLENLMSNPSFNFIEQHLRSRDSMQMVKQPDCKSGPTG